MIETILSRLEKVRKTGASRWIACCPSHKDKSPSFTLRETDDGRILMHCFAGCSIELILSSLDIEFNDLFPKTQFAGRPIKKPFNAHDVLACLETESLIVTMGAKDLAKGRTMDDVSRERLLLASRRIREGVELANG